MDEATASAWLLLIGGIITALAAAIVKILKALGEIKHQNEELMQGQAAHEEKAAARTARLLNEQPPAPYDPKRNIPLP